MSGCDVKEEYLPATMVDYRYKKYQADYDGGNIR